MGFVRFISGIILGTASALAALLGMVTFIIPAIGGWLLFGWSSLFIFLGMMGSEEHPLSETLAVSIGMFLVWLLSWVIAIVVGWVYIKAWKWILGKDGDLV